MNTLNRQAHWENVYSAKGETEVSWFQKIPTVSLDLIKTSGVKPDATILDVGGGASRLVDVLLEEGFSAVTVLDLSEKALATAKARLQERAFGVKWIVADITTWNFTETYDLWHDRATFHFLIEPKDRAAYIERLTQAVRPHGHVIIATFALDGPERCSGLPIVRYDASSLSKALGRTFQLIETRASEHVTPTGGIQRFQFSRFKYAG